MEFLTIGALFSRQGRASVHMYANLNLHGPREAPKPKKRPVALKESDSSNRIEMPLKSATSSFRAVSRDQYEHAFRNRTDGPNPARYHPRSDLLHMRRDKSPQYKPNKSSPKDKLIFLPPCLDEDLACARTPRPKTKNFNTRTKREETKLIDFSKKLQQKPLKTEHSDPKVTGVREFSTVKDREPFVKSTDPPHQDRFKFQFPTSNVVSSNKRPQTVNFDKQLPRKELFKLGMSLDTYSRNEEYTIPKLTTLVMDFSKTQGRDSRIQRKAPESKDLEKFDSAFFMQSNVRGPVVLPKMDTTSPRDDSMYRVTEGYAYNIPARQTSTCIPRFGGSQPLIQATSSSFSKDLNKSFHY